MPMRNNKSDYTNNMPEDVTASSEKKMPPTEYPEAAPEYRISVVEDKSPAPEDINPAPEDISPAPEDINPAPEDISPAPEDYFPMVRKQTPEDDEQKNQYYFRKKVRMYATMAGLVLILLSFPALLHGFVKPERTIEEVVEKPQNDESVTEPSIAEVPADTPAEPLTSEVPADTPAESTTSEVPADTPAESTTSEVPADTPAEPEKGPYDDYIGEWGIVYIDHAYKDEEGNTSVFREENMGHCYRYTLDILYDKDNVPTLQAGYSTVGDDEVSEIKEMTLDENDCFTCVRKSPVSEDVLLTYKAYLEDGYFIMEVIAESTVYTGTRSESREVYERLK